MTGTNTFNATDLQYSIPEVWGNFVDREFQANLLAGAHFMDLSELFEDGGDLAHVPGIYTNVFSANNKSNASEVTLQSPAQGEVQLNINTWKEVSFLLEDKEAEQLARSLNLQREYVEQAAYIVAKAFDTSIMALYSGLSQTVNDTASDVADVDIRNAIMTLDNADVPWSGRKFFFHPTVYWQDIMGIQKYYDAQQFGKGAPVATGSLGTPMVGAEGDRGFLYGLPLAITTQVQEDGASSAYYNMLAHRRTFAYGIQTPPVRTGGGSTERRGVRTQFSYIHENLGFLWTNDSIYGVVELRDAMGVNIKSRQTIFVS